MAEIPMTVEIDCATGATTERPLTDAEIAQRDADAAAYLAARKAQTDAENAVKAAKASALAKLEAIGLTPAEASAVIGL